VRTTAQLNVVCLYDAVGECGAMLHLRLAAPGQSRDPNLTDNTLSGNLSLLTRALAGTERRGSARPALAGAPGGAVGGPGWLARALRWAAGLHRRISEGRGHPPGEHDGSPRSEVSVQFRPALGQVQTQTAAP